MRTARVRSPEKPYESLLKLWLTSNFVDGWSLLGSNAHGRSDRLRSLAWNDEKSKENPIRDVLPQMIDIALEGGK